MSRAPSPEKAVLYVAGRGTRLGPEYADTHKVLLSIGGRSLLERHVDHLVSVGVRELVIVTGHDAAHVAAEASRLTEGSTVTVRTVHNPDFQEGSVLSFLVSLPEIESARGAVLLMDGDVLYPTEMLQRLLASRHPTVLLIDRSYSTDDDDPVLVPVVDGRPVDFRKRWTGTADVVGESIGFFRVAPADLTFLAERTRTRIAAGSREDSYDEVLRDLVVAGRFGHEDVTGLPWTEIDFPADLERAERRVLPAITALPESSCKSSK
ncbi:MAG: phosphocholine cytidylyltransferase family protein [Myxococcales bacterium]|nr:MAG: phosphocholine cytidylyltransferase family protein [Myxococcales bacterium]